MPEQRVFTVAEARAMLPLVRSIVRDIRDVWQQIPIPPLEKMLGTGDPASSLLSPEEQERASALEAKLIEYVNELQELGVSIKAVDTGLVDFLSIRNGKVICLCWMDGEPDILYWHTLRDGFAGRQLLDDATESLTTTKPIERN